MFKKTLVAAAVASASFGLAAPTFAAEGAYINVFGGVSIQPESTLSAIESGVSGSKWKADFKTGYNLGAALGYQIDMFRFEGEATYISGRSKSVKVGGTKVSGLDLDNHLYAGLVNAYMDFTDISSDITPFIGLGGGYGSFKQSTDANGVFTEMSKSDGVWVYQAIAGLSFNIDEQTRIGVDYRYLGTSQAEFRDASGDKLRGKFRSHNVNLSLIYMF